MLFPILNREVVRRAVEQLNTAVPRRGENLVLVDLGPGEVI